MGSISVREHIRWLPDAPSEPTSTLVLTSPGRRFVDVRILKSSNGGLAVDESEGLPLDRLDWAIAGTSSSSQRDDWRGGLVRHSRWHHWVDSRHPDAERVTDEGDMFPQPDGRTLETGRMTNPATGVETDYEELWRDEEPISPTEQDSPVPCTVLQLQEDALRVRGMVVRLGPYCQGILRRDDSITVERWEWVKGDIPRWKRTVRVGRETIPSKALLDRNAKPSVDSEVIVDDEAWRVVEAHG